MLLAAACCLTGNPIVLTPDPTMPTATPLLPILTSPADTPASLPLQTEARINAAVVPIADPEALRATLGSGSGYISPSDPTTPQAYQVGDRRMFQLNGEDVEAELVYATDHIYTWLVIGEWGDRQALIAAADRFEAEIYPAVRRYFGSEWSPGIDGDVHLSMLHYSDAGDDAAGSFDPGDELSRRINLASNEAEMFYVNLDGMDAGDDFYFAVLAHEFEHMVHWNTDRNEADWLDEGLAELACRVAGFDPGSNDEEFFLQPDTQLNAWSYEDDNAVHYGAGYVFALYLWERFGDGLIWDLAHHPADGLAGLDAVLAARGAGLTADQVFADWVVANALALEQDESSPYTHESWKVNLHKDAAYSQYPASQSTTVSPYATDYVELAGQGRLLVRFEGTPYASLWPVKPQAGELVWWSNEGNRSDTRLSRRFDLSGLTSATLRFWTWYDLEDGYDYVYVSASGDEGQTWQVLQGQHSSRGGDYGSGYTGQSGDWIEESISLDRYAGQPVWLRFDYVTDDTINGDGFLLDSVSIPELGLEDGDEAAGWQAEGFVLAGATLPQRWVVQLLEFPGGDGAAQVRRMPLTERQTGEMELTLGAGVERALLAISALARGAVMPAEYQYEIAPAP
jgi:hypothetical protein